MIIFERWPYFKVNFWPEITGAPFVDFLFGFPQPAHTKQRTQLA
jgi:hypothetical protein